MKDNFELRYYQKVSQIQDDCIKDKITKEECEQKIEIERLKFIEYLKSKNQQLFFERKNQEIVQGILKEIGERYGRK